MYICIFAYFPVANYVKKKRNEEMKKKCPENGLGYCPTVSQYNGKLYCDTAGFRGFEWLVVVLQ